MKICHIRGQKKYWEQNYIDLNYPTYTYRDCIFLVYENLNIDFFKYRKKIRDIIIEDIQNKNMFDVICYNDTELYELCNQIDDNAIVTYYAQDDDDIFLKFPDQITDNGLHISKNIFLNPNKLLRKNKKFNFFADNNFFPENLTVNSPIGSCNTLIKEKFKHIKPFLLNICKKSEHACVNIPKQIIENKKYKVLYNEEILNIHILHSLSITFLRNVATLLGETHASYNLIKNALRVNNNTLLKINIPATQVWGNIKNIINQLNNELNIK